MSFLDKVANAQGQERQTSGLKTESEVKTDLTAKSSARNTELRTAQRKAINASDFKKEVDSISDADLTDLFLSLPIGERRAINTALTLTRKELALITLAKRETGLNLREMILAYAETQTGVKQHQID